MRSGDRTRIKYVICVICVMLFSLAGYIYVSLPMEEERESTWDASGYLELGRYLTVQKTDDRLTLLDSKDVLAANGLYYATWTMGDSEESVNSEGETVDLYDVQLYLLLGEHKSGGDAVKDMTKWLDAAKTNYEILEEEEIVCNGQSYSLITYNCVNEDNPYDRGMSAFGVCESISVCIEMTCREGFEEDLRSILIPFLENCSYGNN